MMHRIYPLFQHVFRNLRFDQPGFPGTVLRNPFMVNITKSGEAEGIYTFTDLHTVLYCAERSPDISYSTTWGDATSPTRHSGPAAHISLNTSNSTSTLPYKHCHTMAYYVMAYMTVDTSNGILGRGGHATWSIFICSFATYDLQCSHQE